MDIIREVDLVSVTVDRRAHSVATPTLLTVNNEFPIDVEMKRSADDGAASLLPRPPTAYQPNKY